MRNISSELLKWLMKYPPEWSYFFANVIIVDSLTGNIILSRSEDREQFTPYGGEKGWQNREQSIETARREVDEETGGRVKPKPEELILLDTVKVFSKGNNNDGITRSIDTFVYFTKETDKMPNTVDQEHEEGNRIEEIIFVSFPEIWQLIEQGELKVFPNFIGTLVKLEVFLDNK